MNSKIIAAIAVLMTVFVLLFLSSILGIGALILLPIALLLLLLIQRPRQWFVLTLGLFYSGLYIPGFPSSFDLYHAFAMGLIPLLIASTALNKQSLCFSRLLKTMAVGFLLVMLLTMHQRGTGMAFLGSSMWGGAAYLYMGLAFGLFFFGDSIVLTQRQWKHLLILLFILGLLPALAETAFLLSHGKLVLPFYFIRKGGGAAERNLEALLGYSQAVFRLKTAKNTIFLFVLTLAMLPYKGKYKKWIWLAGLVSLVFVGLSGHRATLFILLAIIPILISFTLRRFPFRVLSVYSFILLFLVLLLAFWGRTLPLAIQRAASWIPFADIAHIARESARSTLEGRVDMWKILIEDYLSKYWLLGRGFGFNAGDLLAVQGLRRATVAYMITNNYHNGILVLLINLGIGGLLFGYTFLLFGFWRHYRLLNTNWSNETLARYHRVLLTFYTVIILAQTAVGCGDWITQPVIIMLIMEGILVTDRAKPADSEMRSEELPAI